MDDSGQKDSKDVTTGLARYPGSRRACFLCSVFILSSLFAGAAILARQNRGGTPSGKLYFVAATLTIKGQPSGYPVTLYRPHGGRLEFARQVIAPGPHSDGVVTSEGSMAPTSLCCVLASENALYFPYPYYSSSTISVVRFADPMRADDIKFNPEGGFTSTPLFVVIPRSNSEDELLIPIITGDPFKSDQSISVTRITVNSGGTRVEPSVDAWDDFQNLVSEGSPGGPASEMWTYGVVHGDKLVFTPGGLRPSERRTVVVALAPPSFRGTKAQMGIIAASPRYVLMQLIRPVAELPSGETTDLFLYDRPSGGWKTLQIEGNIASCRLFGPWLATRVAMRLPNPKLALGTENERNDGTGSLPNVREMYRLTDFRLRPFWRSGTQTLQNLSDGRVIRIPTGQEDSEILNVTGNTILYRVNNAIFQADISGSKLGSSSLLVRDEDVAEIHWAFWSRTQ